MQLGTSQEEPKHRKHMITFYRVKVRFDANEHTKLFRKEEKCIKWQHLFCQEKAIMFCWILANININI
jgi:hypothetical protein